MPDITITTRTEWDNKIKELGFEIPKGVTIIIDSKGEVIDNALNFDVKGTLIINEKAILSSAAGDWREREAEFNAKNVEINNNGEVINNGIWNVNKLTIQKGGVFTNNNQFYWWDPFSREGELLSMKLFNYGSVINNGIINMFDKVQSEKDGLPRPSLPVIWNDSRDFVNNNKGVIICSNIMIYPIRNYGKIYTDYFWIDERNVDDYLSKKVDESPAAKKMGKLYKFGTVYTIKEWKKQKQESETTTKKENEPTPESIERLQSQINDLKKQLAERDLFTKAMVGSWQKEKEYLKEIIREVIGDKTKEEKPVEVEAAKATEPPKVVLVVEDKIQKEIKEIKAVLNIIKDRYNTHRHVFRAATGVNMPLKEDLLTDDDFKNIK